MLGDAVPLGGLIPESNVPPSGRGDVGRRSAARGPGTRVALYSGEPTGGFIPESLRVAAPPRRRGWEKSALGGNPRQRPPMGRGGGAASPGRVGYLGSHCGPETPAQPPHMLRCGVSLRVGGHTDRRAKAPCAPSGSREAAGVYGSGLASPVFPPSPHQRR